jgi:CRISPR-associated Csx2 family protein
MSQTILVSFIGTGQTPRNEKQEILPKSRGKYLLATYKFHHNNEIYEKETTIFGLALLNFLTQKQKRKVTKWLVMGTPQSNWCDLIEAFSDEIQNEIITEKGQLWDKLDNEAKKREKSEISQADLEKWQEVLSSKIKGTEIICRMVGTAINTESQHKIFESLKDVIKSGSNVIFDVTHGLRNQPIITSFALMYLRNVININEIDFYYGAFELEGEVVKLDFCKEIIEATEATAIFKQTGNYRKIGRQLDISESFKSRLDYVVYTDETLKPQKEKAKILLTESKKVTNNPLRVSLTEKFTEALDWANESSSALVWRKKAEMAFEREHFFKAIALLWESVLIAECERSGIENSNDSNERKNADKYLQKRIEKADKTERNYYWHLKNLRNAILHGTQTNDSKVKKALDSLNDYEDIFKGGLNLFNKILANEI